MGRMKISTGNLRSSQYPERLRPPGLAPKKMWFNKTGNMAPLNLAQAQSEIRQYLSEYKIESIERVRSRFVTNYNFRLRLDFGAVKRSDRAQAVTAHGIRHTQPRYRTQGSVQR